MTSDGWVNVADEPTDRLTRLCARMTECLDEPENTDIQAIVLLNDGEQGGVQLHGYRDQDDALADLFMHLRAIFRSQGKDITFIPVPDSPAELDGLS